MTKPGRKTNLSKDLIAEIREYVVNGETIRDIAKICEIPESTLYTWIRDDYLNLGQIVENAKIERKLNLANKNHNDILELGVSDRDSLKVVADMTKFTLETLDKTNYSKRNEHTGADGKDLMPIPILSTKDVQQDNSNPEDNGDEQTNKDMSGGD